ncbi:interactor of HORMAD1 protein 1 isoform X2 [Sceloporus undulatus]|uniref:interactor of HORMAD1 protein 1 isoform X2 n=1 Tax=Sceloporus undulatus TaxID=8520 RepID=UPI001C4CE328|nr:interactor of HORMAD1 protein 1 isoform X2 [Sceloporus undulatus]
MPLYFPICADRRDFQRYTAPSSEVLNSFILNTKESLQRLQSSLDKFADTMKLVLDALENLPKTMQETSQSHYGLILKALKEKNEMEQTLLGMEKRLQDKDTEISDLKANLQLLKETLEQLTTQQKEQHLSLCEQLGLMQLPSLVGELKTFMSVPRAPSHIKDNVSQTSPDLLSTQQSHDSHWSTLNVPPGNKVITVVASSQSKEYVDMQQQSRHIAARGHDANNVLCVCCPSAAFPTGSSEGCWLLTQDLSQATPIRKVVKRDNRANTRRSLQGNAFLQNHADDHKNEALPTDRKMESKGRGKKKRKGKPKIWTRRKRFHSSRKEINCLKFINPNMKQEINEREYSKSEKSQWSYRNPRSPDDSNLGPCTVVLQSHENTQYVANVQGTSGLKNRVDLSSAKNNCFWLNSSPEGCLSPNQENWFSLFDSKPYGTSCQEGTKRYCPLFFDSEYSD